MQDSKIQLEQALLEIGILSDLSHKTRLLHDRTMRMMVTDIELAKNGLQLAENVKQLTTRVNELEAALHNTKEVTQHHGCN